MTTTVPILSTTATTLPCFGSTRVTSSMALVNEGNTNFGPLPTPPAPRELPPIPSAVLLSTNSLLSAMTHNRAPRSYATARPLTGLTSSLFQRAYTVTWTRRSCTHCATRSTLRSASTSRQGRLLKERGLQSESTPRLASGNKYYLDTFYPYTYWLFHHIISSDTAIEAVR